MKKRYIVLIGIVIAVVVIMNLKDNPTNITKSKSIAKKDNGLIAILYETYIESGEYVKSTESDWPTTDYVLNENLSKCINGSKIYYDKEENKVMVEANTEDKCYVYFDQYVYHKHCDEPLLACKVAKNYGSDSTLLLHNEMLENGAEDGSYRYSGKNDEVNNYVCFGSDANACPYENLYRIIGVFDEQVKLVLADYPSSDLLGENGDYAAGIKNASTTLTKYKGKNSLDKIAAYYWNYSSGTNSTNYWADSRLNKINLNTNYIDYLNKINVKWGNMISDTTWYVGGLTGFTKAKEAYDKELGTNGTGKNIKETSKIGLMYVSDYYYSTTEEYWSNPESTNAINNNWLYMGLSEWPISRMNSLVWALVSRGGFDGNNVYSMRAVRPVFYLESIVGYKSGIGTSSDPYRI